MKRFFALVLVLCLFLAVSARADQSTYASLSDDELVAAYKAMQEEITRRGINISEPIIVRTGKYIVGEDIPAGTYVLTCNGTEMEDTTSMFGSLGSMYDDLLGGDTYSNYFSSLGSMYSSLDDGMTVKILGSYGAVHKSFSLKKGESFTVKLEDNTALEVSDGYGTLVLK